MNLPSLTDFEAFRRGSGGPTNSTSDLAALQQALLSKMTAADLRRRAREEQKSLQAYMVEREKRQRATVRPAAAKAPAKPAVPAVPAVDLVNASPAEVGRIIAQCANVQRGAALREQVRNQFASMPPGPERTKFFERFRNILRQ